MSNPYEDFFHGEKGFAEWMVKLNKVAYEQFVDTYSTKYEWNSFVNERSLEAHFKKHQNDLFKTKEDYLCEARSLLVKKIGQYVDGFVDYKNGYLYKYDYVANIFVIGNVFGTIITCFQPDLGVEYWYAKKQLNFSRKVEMYDVA